MGERKISRLSQRWNRSLDRLGGQYVYWYTGYLRKRQAKLQNELDYVTKELAKQPTE